MWKCPNCESLNDGDKCIVCDCPKPEEEPVVTTGYAPSEGTYYPYSPVPPTPVPPTPVPPTPVPPYVTDSVETSMDEPPVGKKGKKKGLIITLCIVAVLILIALGAVIYLEVSYSSANDLLESGNYDDAYNKFSSISFYRNSDDMKKECRYKKAEDLLSNKQYDQAKDIYSSLGAYLDSQDMVMECDYQKANVFFNSKSYDEALAIYTSISTYKDSADKISRIEVKKEDINYQKAIEDYRAGRYSQATTVFNDMADRYDSRKYLTLIDAHNGTFDVEELTDLIGFEDASELLVKKNSTAIEFLTGEWSGNGQTLNVVPGTITFGSNFPRLIEGSGKCKIEDGIMYEGKTDANQRSFSITVLEKDLIEIYSYVNNSTFTMSR